MSALQFHPYNLQKIAHALERMRSCHRPEGVVEQLETTVTVFHPVDEYVGRLDDYINALRTPGRRALQRSYTKLLRGQYVHKRKGRPQRQHAFRNCRPLLEVFTLIDGKTPDGGPVEIPVNARMILVNKWAEIDTVINR